MDNEIPNFFLFDPEVAEKVTETGQKLLREMEHKFKYVTHDMTEHIGSYYGHLVEFEEFKNNEDLSFESNGLQGREDAIEFFQGMVDLGVVDILLDIQDGAADTAFFLINKHTDIASLMVHIHTQRPDEFTRQEDDKWFRIWWD